MVFATRAFLSWRPELYPGRPNPTHNRLFFFLQLPILEQIGYTEINQWWEVIYIVISLDFTIMSTLASCSWNGWLNSHEELSQTFLPLPLKNFMIPSTSQKATEYTINF